MREILYAFSRRTVSQLRLAAAAACCPLSRSRGNTQYNHSAWIPDFRAQEDPDFDAREVLPPSDFVAVCDRFSATYGRFDWTPRVRGVSPARSYRLKAVGVLGRREYEYIGTSVDATHQICIDPIALPPSSPGLKRPIATANERALVIWGSGEQVRPSDPETSATTRDPEPFSGEA